VTLYTFSHDFVVIQPGEGYSSTIACDNFGERPGVDLLINYEFDTAATVTDVTRRSQEGSSTSNGQSFEFIQFAVQNDTAAPTPVNVTVFCENTSP
jgi:hypothetical protein